MQDEEEENHIQVSPEYKSHFYLREKSIIYGQIQQARHNVAFHSERDSCDKFEPAASFDVRQT